MSVRLDRAHLGPTELHRLSWEDYGSVGDPT